MQHTVKKMRLILLALVLLSVNIATATNYWKKYCHKKEYIPRGDKYPHLHCETNFFLLSLGKNDHKNFVVKKIGKALCDNVKEVLENPSYFYNSIPEITEVLEHFQSKECPNNNINIKSPKDKESANNPNKKIKEKSEF